MSRVTCHLSHVTCDLSPVTCKKKNLHFVYNTKKQKQKNNPTQKIGQSGEANWWRVCYQRGLPRLVLIV